MAMSEECPKLSNASNLGRGIVGLEERIAIIASQEELAFEVLSSFVNSDPPPEMSHLEELLRQASALIITSAEEKRSASTKRRMAPGRRPRQSPSPQDESSAILNDALEAFSHSELDDRQRFAPIMQAIAFHSRVTVRDSLVSDIRSLRQSQATPAGAAKSSSPPVDRVRRTSSIRSFSEAFKSPPLLPLDLTGGSAATTSPISSSPLADDPQIVCRICESPVKRSLLEVHTRHCQKMNSFDMQLMAEDVKLWELVQDLEEMSLFAPDSCVLPLLEAAEK